MLGLESGGGALFVFESMESFMQMLMIDEITSHTIICIKDNSHQTEQMFAKAFGMCYTKHNYREDCDYNDYKTSQQRHDKTEQSQ